MSEVTVTFMRTELRKLLMNADRPASSGAMKSPGNALIGTGLSFMCALAERRASPVAPRYCPILKGRSEVRLVGTSRTCSVKNLFKSNGIGLDYPPVQALTARIPFTARQ